MNARPAEISVEQLLQLVKRQTSRTPGDRDLKQQWIAWLAEYSGPGFYGRKTSSHRARDAYVHLHSTPMHGWFALHLGVRAPVVRKAIDAAKQRTTPSAQGAAFRRVVTWAEIETLLRRELGLGIDSPQELRRRVARLSALSPETDRFSRQWRAKSTGQQEQPRPWYQHQKQHWLGWLAEYDGPGAYGRRVQARSAQYAYNHVVNPQMLVWLAEAVGVPRAEVQRAVALALRKNSMAAMSAEIRRVIAWSEIELRLA